MVCHDPVLKRRRCIWAGRNPRNSQDDARRTSRIRLRLAKESPLPAAGFDSRHAHPTLDEVFALARLGDFKFNIEVKSFGQKTRYTPTPDVYARMVMEAVRRHRIEHRVQVQSFDLRILQAVKRLDPEIPLSALCQYERRGFVTLARRARAGTIGPYHRLVTRAKVERASTRRPSSGSVDGEPSRDWERLIRADGRHHSRRSGGSDRVSEIERGAGAMTAQRLMQGRESPAPP